MCWLFFNNLSNIRLNISFQWNLSVTITSFHSSEVKPDISAYWVTEKLTLYVDLGFLETQKLICVLNFCSFPPFQTHFSSSPLSFPAPKMQSANADLTFSVSPLGPEALVMVPRCVCRLQLSPQKNLLPLNICKSKVKKEKTTPNPALTMCQFLKDGGKPLSLSVTVTW